MAAWKYSLVVSDPYTRLTKLNRTAQRSPDRYPRVYGAGQSAHKYCRSKSVKNYQHVSDRGSRLINMGSMEVWFLNKWLEQLDLGQSESEGKEKKRKRSDGPIVASDSVYAGGDGEYNIIDIHRS